MKKILSDILLFFADFIHLLYRAYCRSMNIQVVNPEYSFQTRSEDTPSIFVFWSSKSLFLAPLSVDAKLKHLTFMDFKHKFLQRIIGMREKTKLGFTSASKVTFLMTKELDNGNSVSMIGDGPYGPAGKLKPGSATLSMRTQKTIIPISVEMNRSFRVPWRWDNYEIAMPFSEVKIIFHPPIAPPKADLRPIHNQIEGLLGKA